MDREEDEKSDICSYEADISQIQMAHFSLPLKKNNSALVCMVRYGIKKNYLKIRQGKEKGWNRNLIRILFKILGWIRIR